MLPCLLALSLLAACTGSELSSGPDLQLQVTSGLNYKELEPAALDEPFVSMRVQLCQATGGTHCTALRRPVDAVSRLNAPRPLIAFLTMRGLHGEQNVALTCTLLDGSQQPVWSDRLDAQTPRDFPPSLPFYRSFALSPDLFKKPGSYRLVVAADFGATATWALLVEAPQGALAASMP